MTKPFQGRRARLVALVVGLLAAIGTTVGLLDPAGWTSSAEGEPTSFSQARAEAPEAEQPDVPDAQESPLDIGTPTGLPAVTAIWAPVRASAAMRAAPEASARVLTRLRPRTTEGTDAVARVLDTRQGESGRTWSRIEWAGDEAPKTGWVPRSSLGGFDEVRTELQIDRAERRLTLRQGDTVLLEAPIGIGLTATPTPSGSFYVQSKLTRYSSPTYGPVAFGTSARSALTDWPGGGIVGIHGTNRPEQLPGRVSHGCVRLSNDDVLELAQKMPIGTPVEIV